MQLSNVDLSKKDAKEAERFDRSTMKLYHDDSRLVVEPVHWEKFETSAPATHPYGYVVQSLKKLEEKTVLECGCGVGILSVILAKRGAEHVEAFDISPQSIDIARRRATINNVAEKVNFRVSSIYEMNYKENSFDYIVGMNILHHIDIAKVAEKLYRCLKPGGTAYFNEPFGNERWFQKTRLFVPIRVNEEDRTHWDEQLKYHDVEKFMSIFRDVRYLEFHLLSRLDRVIKSRTVLKVLARIDAWLLKNYAFLRRYARRIVIVLNKS